MKCESCITYPVCRNKILNFLETKHAEDEKLVDGSISFKVTASFYNIFYAYRTFIKPKCNSLSVLRITNRNKYELHQVEDEYATVSNILRAFNIFKDK